MVVLALKVVAPPLSKAALDGRSGELTVFCPACKSLETIWFEDGKLLSTRKYRQEGNLIFHDCGSNRPCRLFRNS
jgi:hypothetical protein